MSIKMQFNSGEKKAVVIVISLNHTGLGIARNLSLDKSLCVIGFVKQKNYACHSTFIDEYVEINPETDEYGTLEWLVRKGEKAELKGFIFPTSETEIEFLLKHENVLSQYYTLSVPNKTVADLILDKFLFYNLLKKHGFNTPETLLIDSINSIEKLIDNNIFPAVLKPAFSGDWKTQKAYKYVGSNKAVLVETKDVAKEKYKLFSILNRRLILQKMIRSEEKDIFSFCCYADKNGKVLWATVTQKILQYPSGFGTAIISKVVKDHEIFNMGKRLIEAIKLNGIAEVEIMRELITGNLNIIEINTRHWQQHIIATKIGLNLSLLDYYYRTGNNKKVEEILINHKTGSYHKGIWIDDISYLIHCLKKKFNYSDCCFNEIDLKNTIFSVLKYNDLSPFLVLIKEKLFY